MNKHLKLFANHSAYSQAESNLDKPNVAVCLLEGDVHYNPIDPFNGHAYVDLGLSSGTLWATMNVGATNVTDYGNYYMYGKGSKTYDHTDTPYTGTENPLDLSNDTARVVWGGEWHMPTKRLIYELVNNTTYLWVNNYLNSGVNGGLFTAQNGNSVFLPAGGYWDYTTKYNVGSDGSYLSSTPSDTYSNGYVDILRFINVSGGWATITEERFMGFSIRPVVG